MNNYYTIPFDPRILIERKKHARCDLKESIRMNIHLIIQTHYKEYRYDPSYGCLIWSKDYSTITNVSQWKDELIEFMLSSIRKNEVRLHNVRIQMNLDDSEFSDSMKKHPIKLKKRITIQIKGIITFLNEPFEHIEYLFFSPLSIG